MSAVASTSRSRQAAAKAPQAQPHDPRADKAKCAAAYDALFTALEFARVTHEAHERAGDSCRLLRIAVRLADDMMVEPPNDLAGIEHDAYEIAALVDASLLVLGGTVSEERRAFLVQVEAALVFLVNDPQPIHWPTDTGVLEEDRRKLTFDANFEISCLAAAIKQMDSVVNDEGCHARFGICSRIELLSDIVFYSARLYVDDDNSGAPDMFRLRRTYQGMMS